MTRPPPSNATSLAARLRNVCRDHAIPEGRARRLLGVVVVGQLLARTGVGVVKGATNLEVRVGTARTRVSSDLDTVRRASLEEFRDRLAESLRVGWEGFTGVVADRGPVDTPAPAAYRPHRLRVRLMYRGGDFASFTIEVSPEEIGALGEPEAITSQEAVGWCEALGLPTQASIPALPLAHQVAQKLHACTAPDTDDWTNDRVHDLVDLQIAMDGYSGTTATSRPPPSGCSPTQRPPLAAHSHRPRRLGRPLPPGNGRPGRHPRP
ncbi:MAG: nucleotidyl transferase AbiEii/AbiGii toxin family protein [Euzebyales bacterium]|nr:nucleotidyl transferase AbiEii/AbiGii toxin family protein [Euzebyales bacterium]